MFGATALNMWEFVVEVTSVHSQSVFHPKADTLHETNENDGLIRWFRQKALR